MGNRDLAGVPIGVHASVKSRAYLASYILILKATRMGFWLGGHSQNMERAPTGTFSAPKALAVYLFEC